MTSHKYFSTGYCCKLILMIVLIVLSGLVSDKGIKTVNAHEVHGPTNESMNQTFDGPDQKHKLFRSLMADPRELTNHASFVRVPSGDSPPVDFTGAFVGIAHDYTLFRRDLESADLEFRFSAGILSQFNLDAASNDLLNTDFLVGFPIVYRNESLSLRTRIMHKSSHLGDEFLLSGNAPPRVNLSLEFVDLIVAYDYRDLRLYGGGSYAINYYPNDLEPGSWQAGLEYVGSSSLYDGIFPIAAVDVTNREATDWSTELSGRVGVRIRSLFAGRTRLDVTLEGFDGPLPFGQFYTVDRDYYGLNFTIGY